MRRAACSIAAIPPVPFRLKYLIDAGQAPMFRECQGGRGEGGRRLRSTGHDVWAFFFFLAYSAFFPASPAPPLHDEIVCIVDRVCLDASWSSANAHSTLFPRARRGKRRSATGEGRGKKRGKAARNLVRVVRRWTVAVSVKASSGTNLFQISRETREMLGAGRERERE